MKKVFVFCIGGTGIRVMKSITMLMAGGIDTNGYIVVPIILDPHLDLEEKKNLHPLIDCYKDVYDKSINNGSSTLNSLDGFFNSEIRTINELNNQTNDTQQIAGSKEKFRSYIGLVNLGADDLNNYLVETMFSTKNLDNPLSVGFKGNPNVGTVVLGEMIEGADWFRAFKQHCEKDDRVFIISSIFGGTGASALFDFLKRGKPVNTQYLTRAIESDEESLDLVSLGKGYKDIVKSVADFMLLRNFVNNLPSEKYFPLSKNRGFDSDFYKDSAFQSLTRFTEKYYNWYSELAQNKRAFSPLHYDNKKQMGGWIKSIELDAKDDSYYLLQMIKASNREKSKDHSNKFRFFLQFAYEAIDNYTKKINN